MSTNNYGQPDWLKENADGTTNNNNSTTNDSSQFTAVNIEGGETSSFQASNVSNTANELDGNNNNDKKIGCMKCLRYCGLIITLGLLVLFVLSSWFQKNDGGDSLSWLLFYAFHAISVALFFVAGLCCTARPFMTKVLVSLASAMMVWSIIMIALSSKQLKDSTGGAGDDSSRFDDKQEKTLEIFGASLGLFSSIYHMLVWTKCCCGNSRGSDDKE